MIKNTIFLFSLTFLLVACVDNNTYVNSDQTIMKNAQKHSAKLAEKKEPIITPEEYKKMLKEEDISTEDNSNEIDMNQALRDFYNEWKSVKYKYGGNSKKVLIVQLLHKEYIKKNLM